MNNHCMGCLIGLSLGLSALVSGCGDADTVLEGMIRVPGGSTWIGCNADMETNCKELFEAPRHAVTFSTFTIDQHEVTASEYVAFLDVHGNSCGDEKCVDDYDWFDDDSPVNLEGETWSPRAGTDEHPITKVSWFGADAYCRWADKRLCSEVEWEVAALGACHEATCETDKPVYPWGDEAPSCALAHMVESDPGCGTKTTAPVGSYPEGASPYGALDMAGNVWEWVADLWHDDYEGAPVDGSAWVPTLCDGEEDCPADTGPCTEGVCAATVTTDLRVVRGGGLGSGASHLRGSHRHNAGPGDLSAQYGFRCCR